MLWVDPFSGEKQMISRPQPTVLKEVKALMKVKAEKYERALKKIEGAIASHKECPYLWLLRGDLIQLLQTLDGPPLKAAASSYSKALKLNPNNLEAIESLAHFYDAVVPAPVKAKRYARIYIETVKQSLCEMERIVVDAVVRPNVPRVKK
jgi:Tfp pilus assembly protein PilF